MTSEDETAIRELAVSYCWAIDTGDFDALRRVFTAGATASFGGTEHVGVEAIIGAISSALRPLDASQHLIGTHQIHVDGDTATARCQLQAQHVRQAASGGSRYMVGGRYEDTCVRTPEGWRISARELVVAWTDGNREVIEPTSA